MKNKLEELKRELVSTIERIISEEPAKTLYNERVEFAKKRQEDCLNDISSVNSTHPEMVETILTDFAYSVLELFLEGTI
jgi:hypothetical protein